MRFFRVYKIYLLFSFAFLLFVSCADAPLSLGPRPASQELCSELFANIFDGNRFEARLEDLDEFIAPGQANFGIPRIQWLTYFFKTNSSEKIQAYLNRKIVPVAVGPDGRAMASDRHHLLIALVKNEKLLKQKFGGSGPNIQFLREADFRLKSQGEFEDFLNETGNVFLLRKGDQINFGDLPSSLSNMEKDFFRGVAWVLKKMKVTNSVDQKFVEFLWANRLREVMGDIPRKWKKKNIKAIIKKINEHPELFNDLPGFNPQGVKFKEAMKNFEKFSPAFKWAN